jgi:hypothetical protein
VNEGLYDLRDEIVRDLDPNPSSPTAQTRATLLGTINSIVNQADRAGGVLPGSNFRNIRNEISDFANSGSANLKYYGGRIANILDRAMERQSTVTGNYGDYTTSRAGLGNMKLMQGAIDRDDLVNPSRLATIMDTNANAGLTTFSSRQDARSLWDYAVAGQRLLSGSKVSNSGTNFRAISTLLGPSAVLTGADALYNRNDPDYRRLIALGAGGFLVPMVGRAFNQGMFSQSLIRGAQSPLLTGTSRLIQAAGAGAGTREGQLFGNQFYDEKAKTKANQ